MTYHICLPRSPHSRHSLVIAATCALLIAVLGWVTIARVSPPPQAEWLYAEVRAVAINRVLAAVLIGGALGIAGVLLRLATKNPLADPAITGVNAGAALGAVLLTSLTGLAGGTLLLPSALIGGSCAAAVTVGLGTRGRTPESSGLIVQRLVLLGMAVSALCSALTAVILVLDEAQLIIVLSWLSGTLAGVRLPDLIPLMVAVTIVVPSCLLGARGLDSLVADDTVSASVGNNPRRLRVCAIIAAVALVCPCVAAAGPIGFLGLMAAVTAERVTGPRHRLSIPLAAALGATVLLCADTIGQWLWAPAETPVGIITAILGVPFLLWGVRKLRMTAGGRR